MPPPTEAVNNFGHRVYHRFLKDASSVEPAQDCARGVQLLPRMSPSSTLPPHPVDHPFPRHVLGVLRRWRWNWTFRKHHQLSPIRLGKPLEHPSLLLHLAVIGQQAQAVFERIEFKFSAHIMRVPICEPA